MILDKQNLLSEDQAIIATAVSTNVIDLGADHARIQEFAEKNFKLFAQVTANFNTLTSLAIVFQTDDDVAFGSVRTLDTVSVALADLVAGKRVEFHVPTNVERYIRFNYVVTGTDPTLGNIMAGVALDTQTNQSRNL